MKKIVLNVIIGIVLGFAVTILTSNVCFAMYSYEIEKEKISDDCFHNQMQQLREKFSKSAYTYAKNNYLDCYSLLYEENHELEQISLETPFLYTIH